MRERARRWAGSARHGDAPRPRRRGGARGRISRPGDEVVAGDAGEGATVDEIRLPQGHPPRPRRRGQASALVSSNARRKTRHHRRALVPRRRHPCSCVVARRSAMAGGGGREDPPTAATLHLVSTLLRRRRVGKEGEGVGVRVLGGGGRSGGSRTGVVAGGSS
jgi:hypothetical protein